MNRTVVISGATGALGSRTAQAFAARGDNLVLLDRDASKLDSLVRDLSLPAERIDAQVADLLDPAAVRASAAEAAARFGAIHGLIHLVGGWTGGRTIPESEARDFEFMLAQHAWTSFHLFQAYAPHLAAAQWGRVIVVSQPVTLHPAAKSALYAAAKAAQESLALTLAEEYRGSGLTANVIHVRSIDARGQGQGTSPDEIVAAMLYLFSEQADRLSGARIPLY